MGWPLRPPVTNQATLIINMQGERIVSKLFFDSDKYGDESPSGVVASFHGVIQAIVRQRFRDSGQEWKDFVFGAAVDGISKDDFLRVEQELLSAHKTISIVQKIEDFCHCRLFEILQFHQYV